MLDRPSGLALSRDGSKLYVTHLFSNQITVLTIQPEKVYLPFVVGDGSAGAKLNSALPHPMTIFSDTLSLWPDSNLVQSFIISPIGDEAYIPHTRSNTSNRALFC